MSVMERAVTETSLPIYHRSIDWDALYKRYPVPDVFERTRWRWPADQIRAFQNEQFLDLMKTGWQNEFYKRRWKASRPRAGRHQEASTTSSSCRCSIPPTSRRIRRRTRRSA